MPSSEEAGPVLDTTERRRIKKAVVCVAQLVAALITVHGLLSFLSDVYGLCDPSGKTLWLSVDHRRFTRSLRASSLTEHNKSTLTDHATQENHVIAGLKRRWSTESQSVLPDESKRPYTSERNDNRSWTVMRAATNWATHTTALLTRRLPVVSKTGITEYQLLLMKASNRGRNVKF